MSCSPPLINSCPSGPATALHVIALEPQPDACLNGPRSVPTDLLKCPANPRHCHAPVVIPQACSVPFWTRRRCNTSVTNDSDVRVLVRVTGTSSCVAQGTADLAPLGSTPGVPVLCAVQSHQTGGWSGTP